MGGVGIADVALTSDLLASGMGLDRHALTCPQGKIWEASPSPPYL